MEGDVGPLRPVRHGRHGARGPEPGGVGGHPIPDVRVVSSCVCSLLSDLDGVVLLFCDLADFEDDFVTVDLLVASIACALCRAVALALVQSTMMLIRMVCITKEGSMFHLRGFGLNIDLTYCDRESSYRLQKNRQN